MAKSFPNTGVTTGTAADRAALSSPFAGMEFFETDTNKVFVYSGATWVEINDLDNTGAASDALNTALADKISSGSYLSTHGGIVYGNMYAGTSSSTTKVIGTVTHNFGTTNYIVILTPFSTNSYGDGFSANAQARATNSFQIVVSRVGGTNWGDTGVYCSYFAWRW